MKSIITIFLLLIAEFSLAGSRIGITFNFDTEGNYISRDIKLIGIRYRDGQISHENACSIYEDIIKNETISFDGSLSPLIDNSLSPLIDKQEEAFFK